MRINNHTYKPFSSAFDQSPKTGQFVGRRVAERIPYRENKVTTLDRDLKRFNSREFTEFPTSPSSAPHHA
jgi:hypothetical protein